VTFSAVGDYPITVTLGSNPNYDVTSSHNTLTIGRKAASVTADAKSKTYGDDNPALTAAVTGTVNGDALNYNLATTAVKFSGVGSYPIGVTLGTNPNYGVTKTDNTLTVTKAALTITADAVPLTAPNDGFTKIVGAPNPSFAARYDGFLGTDTPSGLGGALAFTTPATASSTVGSYVVTPGGQTSGNYTISYVAGNLTVLYGFDGFLQPINDTAHQIGVQQSKFKLGQTIPAKFVIKNAAGVVVTQSGNPPFSRSANRGSCDPSATLESPEPVAATDAPVYVWIGDHYQYNWSTKGLTAGVYRIFANLADGTAPYVDICLQK
jgi:hypothetical protein